MHYNRVMANTADLRFRNSPLKCLGDNISGLGHKTGPFECLGFILLVLDLKLL